MLDFLPAALASVLLPPLCPLCLARRPGAAPPFCDACRRELPKLEEPFCTVCGVPFAGAVPSHPCPQCRSDPPDFRELRAWGVYRSGLLELIHSFKYRRRLFVRKALQGLAAEVFDTYYAGGEPFSAVVPVPCDPGTLRVRGFDLPAVLARSVARRAGLPWRPRALRKTRRTPDLVGLGGKERRRAVEGAYEGREGLGGRVLLVDDVATSTSTARACAKACLAAGACSVSALVLARTPLEIR